MEKQRKQSVLKKIAALMILSVLFVFTGCVRYEVKLSIDKDGRATIVLTYAALKTESSSTSSLAESKLKYLNAGFEVEDYIETTDGNTYVGFTAKKEGSTLDKAIADMSSKNLDFGSITLSKDDEGVYFLAMNFDSETSQAQSSGASSSTLEKYGGYMRFVLEVPGKIVESNATSKSGKTLTWDLMTADEFMYAKFTLEGGGGFSIPMWAIGVLCGGIIIIGGVFFAIMIISNKKKAEAYSYTSSQPSYTPDPEPDPEPVKPFTTSQSTGLPQMGDSNNAGSGADDGSSAPTATRPIWERPASSGLPDPGSSTDDDSFLN